MFTSVFASSSTTAQPVFIFTLLPSTWHSIAFVPRASIIANIDTDIIIIITNTHRTRHWRGEKGTLKNELPIINQQQRRHAHAT